MSVSVATTRLQRFAPNPHGRDYVVGDIHGCFALLQLLLSRIGFDRATDRLFALGDLIDRGPDSADVCAWLAQPWFHAIRGNHEQMLLDAVRLRHGQAQPTAEAGLWLANGGDWYFRLDDATQTAIRQRIAVLPWALEVALAAGATAALVHADVLDDSWSTTRRVLQSTRVLRREQYMHVLWSRQRATAAMQASARNRRGAPVDVADVDLICFGHTPMARPLALGNTRWLDTGAVFGGRLSVAELRMGGQVWSLGAPAGDAVAGWQAGV